jgi:hypothetical protein
MNSKNAASNYLKSDSQTMWSRNSANGTAGGQRKRTPVNDAGTTPAVSAPEVEVDLSLCRSYFALRALMLGQASETWVRHNHHTPRHSISSRWPGYRRVPHQCTSRYSSKNFPAVHTAPFVHQSYPSFQENSIPSSSTPLS